LPPSRRARTPRPTKTDRAHACDGAVAYRCWGGSIASNGLSVRDAGTILALVNAIRPSRPPPPRLHAMLAFVPGIGQGPGPLVLPKFLLWSDRFPSRVARRFPIGDRNNCLARATRVQPNGAKWYSAKGSIGIFRWRQIVPCVTAQPVMQGLGSHTRTRVRWPQPLRGGILHSA
jgi:hypothetical protein